MTDILLILPDFSLEPFSHLLLSLDKSSVTTADLLSNEAVDVARRAQVPSNEVAKLVDALVEALHNDTAQNELQQWDCISILDEKLDEALGGGFPVGYLSEVTGESGAGKSQFLLSLLLTVQLPSPRGTQKSAIYISTEAALSTSRLTQLLESHPQLSDLAEDEKPSLSKVHAIQTLDLEAQEQIIRYQLPVAIERLNIGLVVIDSIASNYRAEFDDLPGSSTPRNAKPTTSKSMGERMRLLTQMGTHLRDLARRYRIAIVVSNQVADRFEASNIASSDASYIDPLSLDHQQNWITGWGDLSHSALYSMPKTPSLGLVWTNQISTRIALIKESAVDERKRRRWMRVAFSSWAPQTDGIGIEYEITWRGICSIGQKEGEDDDGNGDENEA